jgi:nucleoside-diphosphate-sugar epimerase
MSDMSFSNYGILKKLGEKYTKSLNGVSVKLWNVYGYERDLNKSHVITDFILMAKNENKIQMKTDGTEFRQFLYVEDCCDCLIKLMGSYDTINKDENLHITSFVWSTVYEIAEIVSKSFNNCKIEKSGKKDLVQLDSKIEPDPYILNFWSPKTEIQNGINKIIKKY